MKLSDLIKNVDVLEIINQKETEIEDVVIDSFKATKNSMFICLIGKDYDGHNFVADAYKYGATVIVCERKIDFLGTQIIVKNSRKALSIIASNFYGNKDKKLKIIGVIGTNGKTTTAHLIASILINAGVNCGLIGTLGTFYSGKVIEPSLTTPDPLELHKVFSDMYDNGVETVVMEVSAHAIYLDKVYGMNFFISLFTNFTQDHLDFFGDMEHYRDAKLKFFKEIPSEYVVANSDDELGREICKINNKTITYGINNPSDVFAINLKETNLYSTFVLNLFDCVYNVKLNLIGTFNVYNALAASTVSAIYGIKPDEVISGLENLKGVSGRLENVYSGKFEVFIDYAHTPDGLKKALKALKPICHNRLICVFGCGGNRDMIKRPIMGEISGEYADFTVLTSDNPRFEEPMDIISEIEKGLISKTTNYIIIQDRKEAISYALNFAEEDDIILIAGKGSEKYQDVFGIKKLYNDKDTVGEVISLWQK